MHTFAIIKNYNIPLLIDKIHQHSMIQAPPIHTEYKYREVKFKLYVVTFFPDFIPFW